MRANRLDVALGGTRQSTDSLKVLVRTPARRQGGEIDVDDLHGGHCEVVVVRDKVWWDFFAAFFFCPDWPPITG